MKITTLQWVGMIVSFLTMGVGVTTFSYSTFVVKDQYKEDKQDIKRTLERIENKIDNYMRERQKTQN